MQKRGKKALIAIPALKVLGGAEAVAVWMLEALKVDYDLTVLAWEADHTDELNRIYGTSLTPADFQVLRPSRLRRYVFDRIAAACNRDLYFEKACQLYRLGQRTKDDFDVLISAMNELDFGRPSIQYVHYPLLGDLYQAECRAISESRNQVAIKRWWIKLKRHCRPWRIISGLSFARLKGNLTLVNSDWTGDAVYRLYGIEPQTVFPPVAGDFPDIPWDQRQDRFVCLGRIASPKRLEMIIGILSVVRAQGYNVRLQIIGLWGNDAAGRAYYETVKRLVREHAEWVSLSENIARDKLVELVSGSRYGIHAAYEEHFGIAPAEMVQAGCITFTGREGGQAEIVGQDERLIFDSVDDGAAKILNVLRSPQQQLALREHLARRRSLFTAQEFVQRFREMVKRFEAAQLQ